MPQQHGRAEHRRVGICDALAGDVGRGAVNRFVHAELARTERGRGQQAERTGQHRCFVRQNVAEHVLGEDHVEARRLADQVHCCRVDQHVLELDVRELCAQYSFDRCAPQARSLQHIRLVDGHDALATPLREPARDTRDTSDFLDAIRAQVAREILGATLLAEVDAAGQFADDHDVGAAQHLRLERRDVEQCGMNRHRPQVGEQVQPFAQSEQSLLGANLRLRIGPLRSADSPEQHCVGRAARGQRLRRQRGLRFIDRGAANHVLREGEFVAVARRNCLQRAHAFARDFRTDAVAAEDDDRCFDSHVAGSRL